MAKSYAKRRRDGTLAYYDTEEEMYADREIDFSWFWAFVGFVLSSMAVTVAAFGLDLGSAWPKALRMIVMLCLIGLTAYAFGRMGRFVLRAFLWLLAIGFAINVVTMLVIALFASR